MIKSVLFDLEGTITDTEWINREGYIYAAEQIALKGDIREDLVYVTGRNHSDIGIYFKKKYGEDFPYDAYMEHRRGYISSVIAKQGVPLKPGVPQVFDALRAMGCRVALVSSTNPVRVGDFLSRAGLTDQFDVIVTGERVSHSKPAPDIYLLGAREVGCTPDECVVVEDSENGVLSGVRAGMRTVMVPDLQPCTDELRAMLWGCVESLSGLPELIRNENEKTD